MEAQLPAGKAEVVITPPLGVSMAGYYTIAGQTTYWTTCMPGHWSPLKARRPPLSSFVTS
jgi:hypothetical protein